jgi:hypothetical protein
MHVHILIIYTFVEKISIMTNTISKKYFYFQIINTNIIYKMVTIFF